MEPTPANSISSMTRADLVRLRQSYGIEPYFRLEAPNAYERACWPPTGRICLYEEHFRAGLRIPLELFYIALLMHIRLAPAALTPYSWRCISGFYASCVLSGVEPSFRLFKYLFSVRWILGGGPRGWHHIAWRGRRGVRRLIVGVPTSTPGWETRFFFVSRFDGGEWRFPPWGMLSARENSDPPLDREIRDALVRLNGSHVPPSEGLLSVGTEVAADADLAPRVGRRRETGETSNRLVRARTVAPSSSTPAPSLGAPALTSPSAAVEEQARAVVTEFRVTGGSLSEEVVPSQIALDPGIGGARRIVAGRFPNTNWDFLLASDDEQDPPAASRSPPPSP